MEKIVSIYCTAQASNRRYLCRASFLEGEHIGEEWFQRMRRSLKRVALSRLLATSEALPRGGRHAARGLENADPCEFR